MFLNLSLQPLHSTIVLILLISLKNSDMKKIGENTCYISFINNTKKNQRRIKKYSFYSETLQLRAKCSDL